MRILASRRTHVLLATALAWTLGIPAAHAAETAGAAADSAGGHHFASLYDKWQVSVSGTAVIISSDIRIDAGDQSFGTDIDAEDDLGLEKVKFEPRGAIRWRPGHKHEIEAGYQFARRSSEKVLERTIDFGDSTYDAGAHVATTFNTDHAFLNYRFAIIAKERTQAGIGLGLGALFFKIKLDALAYVGSTRPEFAIEKSVVGPLGSLGLYGRFLAGDRWYFEADGRLVKISIDRFDIQVAEVGAAARYFFSPKFGVEAGLGASTIKVDLGPKTDGSKTLATGQLKYRLTDVRLGVVWVP